MDFGTLLHKAQKNEKVVKKEPVRCYSTKFEPPKKEQRNKEKLSENIKKFLAKKEAEERKKKNAVDKKRDDLLALRAQDKKATRRMNVMLKRTKSANQSVLQDAIDVNNTSVTLAGPIQPDEDDYGYVSQEAAAFYNKMMEKYSKMPDEPKFNKSKKKVSTDLNGTRERVKAAMEREKEEALMPHRRKRKHNEVVVDEVVETKIVEEKRQKVRSKMPPPPTLNFNDLLKLAEKKQFEPIVIEPKPKEEEKLFTKKQKKEMEREKEWRDRKEGKLPPLEVKTKIPTIEKVKVPEIKKLNKPIDKRPISVPSPSVKPSTISKPINNVIRREESVDLKKKIINNKDVQARRFPPDSRPRQDLKSRQIPPTEVRRQLPVKDVKLKQFPPKDLKPKQFPPPDVRRREFPPKDVVRKPMNNRRILDDDDEEYDSEMDDFIDDGPEDVEDLSKTIGEIFGYDKSKYRYAEDDIDNMESTFAQQMREEVISTKIGIMEDLEDMRQEEEDKKRKTLLKKRGKL